MSKITEEEKRTIQEHIHRTFQAGLEDIDEKMALDPASLHGTLAGTFADDRPILLEMIKDALSLNPTIKGTLNIQGEQYPFTSTSILKGLVLGHLDGIDGNKEASTLETILSSPEKRGIFEREYGKAFLKYGRVATDLLKGNEADESAFHKTPPAPLVSPKEEPEESEAPLFSAVWSEYRTLKTRPDVKKGKGIAWDGRTLADYDSKARDFLEIVGDYSIDSYTEEQIDQYLNTLYALPTHRNKRAAYRDKPISELIHLDMPPEHQLSLSSVEQHVKAVKAAFTWARDSKRYMSWNPMQDVVIPKNKTSYRPFSEEDLNAIFHNDRYNKGSFSNTWQFWAPLMALYTGARQGEICQLSTNDLYLENGVFFFRIHDDDLANRLKNPNATRIVPINSTLISLGLAEYTNALRKKGIKRLFPDLKLSTKKSVGHAVSTWFNGYESNPGFKHKAGVDLSSPELGRKTFHSFRHNAITKANQAKVDLRDLQAVVGHERGASMGATAIYDHPEPKNLTGVVEAFNWGIDHSNIKDQWKMYAAKATSPR